VFAPFQQFGQQRVCVEVLRSYSVNIILQLTWILRPVLCRWFYTCVVLLCLAGFCV